MIINILYVAIGGAIGSVLRYLAGKSVQDGMLAVFPARVFPWGTLFVNVVGCFVIGLMWGLDERTFLSSRRKDFILVGILGGFTTFSSFGLETGRLLADGQWGLAAANVAVSNVVGIVMVLAGMLAMRWTLNWLR